MEETDEKTPTAAQDGVPFKWNEQREQAAQLIAEGDLSDSQIAERLEIGRRTLFDWRQRPEFLARVDEDVVEFRKAIRARGIAVMENRVRHLQRRHDAMNRIISERGASDEMQNIPGGTTGLIVKNVKAAGGAVVETYEFDAALDKALRDTEKQAAQELGQWMEKKDFTSGGKTMKAYMDIDDGDDDGGGEQPGPTAEG